MNASVPSTSSPSTCSPALVRFTVTGLLATIDAHLAGHLPPARFHWELSARIDQLAALDTPTRVLTRLRWLRLAVERTPLSGGHPGADGDHLVAAVATLRTVLATLTPPSPVDPAGAGRPSAATAATPLRPAGGVTGGWPRGRRAQRLSGGATWRWISTLRGPFSVGSPGVTASVVWRSSVRCCAVRTPNRAMWICWSSSRQDGYLV